MSYCLVRYLALLLTACGQAKNSHDFATDTSASAGSSNLFQSVLPSRKPVTSLYLVRRELVPKLLRSISTRRHRWPIKLVFQDTGRDEARAINAFQTLINKDKVVGIVGPTLTTSFSADPIAERASGTGSINTAKELVIARVSAPVSIVARIQSRLH